MIIIFRLSDNNDSQPVKRFSERIMKINNKIASIAEQSSTLKKELNIRRQAFSTTLQIVEASWKGGSNNSSSQAQVSTSPRTRGATVKSNHNQAASTTSDPSGNTLTLEESLRILLQER
jgi:hypothetical protein